MIFTELSQNPGHRWELLGRARLRVESALWSHARVVVEDPHPQLATPPYVMDGYGACCFFFFVLFFFVCVCVCFFFFSEIRRICFSL